MNIRDFLTENYIWIIVVILLCIITVIGFLADKSKGKKDKVKEPKKAKNAENLQMNNEQPQAPIEFQPQQMNNFGQNQNNMGLPQTPNNFGQITNTTINPINQNMGEQSQQMNTIPEPMNVIPNQNIGPMPQTNGFNIPIQGSETFNQPESNITPVENVNQNNFVNPEPMYQPLSEQTPNIKPREVIPSMVPNQEFNIPNNQMGMIQNEQPINVIPVQAPPVAPTIVPNMNAPLEQQPVNNMNMNMGMNNNQMLQQNNMFQSNQVQAPNMNQQPTMMNNQGMMNMPNSGQMPNQEQTTIPNPVPSSQPVNPSPINFVYGAGTNNNNNNNQFM